MIGYVILLIGIIVGLILIYRFRRKGSGINLLDKPE
jgi:hypothetical protein